MTGAFSSNKAAVSLALTAAALLPLASAADSEDEMKVNCHANPACSWEERFTESNYVSLVFDWVNVVLLLFILAIMAAARLLYVVPLRLKKGFREDDRGRRFNFQKHLVEEDNKALAISLSGYIIGLGFVATAAMSDFGITADDGFAVPADQGTDTGVAARGLMIAQAALYSALGAVLLFCARWINRRLIVRIPLLGLIVKEQNLAAACVDAGGYVASGLIVAGSVSGQPSANWGEDIGGTLLYFVLGQLSMFLMGFIFQFQTKFDVFKEIKESKNVAAGLAYALRTVAIGNLLSNSIYKSDSLAAFALWFALGAVILILVRFIIDKLLLPAESLDKEIQQDHNWGAALLSGSVQVIITIVINNFIKSPCVAPSVFKATSLAERLVDTAPAVDGLRVDRLFSLLIFVFVMVVSKSMYALPFWFYRRREARRSSEAAETADPDNVELKPVGGDGGGESSGLVGSAAASFADFDLDRELVKRDNKAVAISYTCYLIALGFLMTGSMSELGVDGDVESSLLVAVNIIIWIFVGLIFMCVSHIIVDHFVMRGFMGAKELSDGNIASACAEGGAYVAAGLFMLALIGDNTIASFGDDMLQFIIFYLLAHILLVVFAFLFEKITPYNSAKEIADENAAAGLNFGLNLVAFGMVCQRSIEQSESVVTFLVWTALGTALLFASRVLCDKIIIPGQPLNTEIAKDKNWGAALISGAISVSMAQLMNTFLRWCPYALQNSSFFIPA